MKKYLILLAAILICYFAGSQIIRPNPTTNFQQFGTPVTYTRINGLLYPAVGYAPALYADTAAMNATYLKNVPLAHAATSDGKWWVRSYDVQKWLQVYISGISSPGIDDVLAVGQSLTANRSINLNSFNLGLTSGNVGIGTSSPAKVFHTVGTVRMASLGTASSDTTTYKPVGINSSGDVIPMTYWPGGGTNIYNSDGTLTGNRNINNGGYNLTFYSATDKKAARIDSLQRLQVNKISAITENTVSAYEIIMLPDLQHMTTTYPSVLRTITDWIVANKTTKNIKAVISVGDLTNNYGVNAEFDTIRANFNTIHAAGIPILPVIGNHDYNNIAARVDTTWQNYFGPSYFSDKPYYAGSMNGNTANYFINIDVGAIKYTFVAIEFFPSDAAIAWADSVISTIPDRKVIVCTHAYIDEKGQRTLDNSLYGVNNYFTTESANNGQELWEKLISKYSNIEFVFAGHHIEGLSFTHLTDVGKHGNIVNQIYYNRQGDANGGNGYFMRLRFNPDSTNVRINTYSNFLSASDPLVPEFVLDYPGIQIDATVGVKNIYSYGELRADSSVYFQKIPQYSIPFFGLMGKIKNTSVFQYNDITNTITSPNSIFSTSFVLGNTSLAGGSVGTIRGNTHFTDTSKISFNSLGNEYIFSRKNGNISSVVRGNFEWFSDINLNNGSSNMDYRWFTNTQTANGDVTAPKMALTNDGALSIGAGINDVAASSILELRSTTRGLLPPRLTTTQMNAIASPGTGLMVWNTDSLGLCSYDGTAWRRDGHDVGSLSNLTIGTTTIANSVSGSVLYDSSGILSRNDEFYWDRTNKRLGIGTNTPSYKLDVNGKSIFRDSLKYTLSPASGYLLTSDANGNATWKKPYPYSLNPSTWLVSPTKRAQANWPEFYTSGISGDSTGSYYETSMYTPSPVKMNDGTLYVWTKGDLNKVIYGWKSIDNGITWDTVGQTLSKGGTGTFDEFSIAMPAAYHIAATDSIYLYYDGIPVYPYENGGIGLAVAAGSAPNTMTKKKQALSIPDFKTQMGISHNLIYISLGSIIKYGTEYYFYGGYWKGAFGMVDSTIRIWEGHSNSLDTIKNCREILAPTAQYTMYDMPTVYHGADSAWYMIFTKGFTDENGGIDSSSYLVSAVSNSITSSNWTELPGRLYEHDVDSTWKGKRVYNAKLLKDEYGNPILMKRDSVYGYPDDGTEPFYMLFYSGSYRSSYHDQSSYLKIMPQTDTLTFGTGYNGTIPNITRRGTTTLLNLPVADSARDGQISHEDWTTFNNKAPSSGGSGYVWNQGANAQTGNLWLDNIVSGSFICIGKPSSSILHYGYIGGDAAAGIKFYTDRFNIESKAGLSYPFVQIDTRSSATTTTPIIFSSPHVSGYSTAITQDNYSLLNVGDIIYTGIPSPFNTTSSALTNYSARFINYGHRTSGSNPLTNVALYLEADSAQNNYALITGNGYVGIGTSSPTAALHIKAGTASANTAPLKLTTGTSLTTAEAGALEYSTPQLFFTNGAAVRQELFQGNQNFVQTQFDKTSNTTLGDVTNLSVNVAAGKAYRFEAILYTSSNVAGGVKAAIAGTATATTIIYEGLTTDAGLTTQSRATSLGTAVGGVTAVTAAYIKITGTIIVNAAGTLTVQFAQNASNGSASSVLVGSTFHVIELAYFP